MVMEKIISILVTFLLEDIVLENRVVMVNSFGKINNIIKDSLIKDRNKDLESGKIQKTPIEINIKDNF